MAESIYNWIKEVPPPPEKPPMYHSTHPPTTEPYRASSTFTEAAVRKAFGSIGREVKPAVKPDVFLKAHEKTAPVTDATVLPAKYVRADPPRKAPVPKRGEAPLHGLSSGKDFVTANAVEAILAVPKLPKEEVDWLKKEDYGRVPSYLAEVKAEMEAEHEYIQSLLDQRQMEEEEASGTRMRELSSAEREDLIAGLKRKWDEVNAAYQRITFKKISTSNSTIGEIRWKEQCESALAQIERDIDRLSVKAPIFVVDDTSPAAAGSGSGGRGVRAGATAAVTAGSRR